MTRGGRLLGRHPTVTARPTAGRLGRVAGLLAARLKEWSVQADQRFRARVISARTGK